MSRQPTREVLEVKLLQSEADRREAENLNRDISARIVDLGTVIRERDARIAELTEELKAANGRERGLELERDCLREDADKYREAWSAIALDRDALVNVLVKLGTPS